MTHRILLPDHEPDITALAPYQMAPTGHRVLTVSRGRKAQLAAVDMPVQSPRGMRGPEADPIDAPRGLGDRNRPDGERGGTR